MPTQHGCTTGVFERDAAADTVGAKAATIASSEHSFTKILAGKADVAERSAPAACSLNSS
jgi:hypothetical protein